MARPRKGAEIGAAKTIAVRITDDAREKLDRIVAENGSTLTDEVRMAIDAHIARFATKKRPKR